MATGFSLRHLGGTAELDVLPLGRSLGAKRVEHPGGSQLGLGVIRLRRRKPAHGKGD